MARRTEIRTDIVAKDKTRAAFNRVQKSMKRLKKAGVGLSVGMAGVLTAFTVMSKKAVNFGDSVAKQADRLGVTTTALQEFRLAADLAGVSNGALDGAIARMSKSLGEMRTKQGTLYEFLRKSDQGFIQQLESVRENSIAFRMLIQKVESLSNVQDKAALSSAAFGRTAGTALALLTGQKLEQGIALAREFGTVLDEKWLREAEKIKDALTIAAAVFKKELFENLIAALKQMDVAQMARDFARLTVEIFSAAVELGKFFGIISRSKLEILNKQLAKAKKNLRGLEDTLMVTFDKHKADNLRLMIAAQQRRVDLLKDTIKKLKGISGLEVTVTPGNIEYTDEVVGGFNATLEVTKTKADAVTESFVRAKTPLENYSEAAQDLKQSLQQVTVDGLRGMEDALLGVIEKTMTAKEAFRVMALSIIRDLQRILIQKHITGPLAGRMDGFFSSLFAGSGTSGFNVGSYGGGHYATGGYAPAGRPALVGERGPEVIVPGRGGTVIPNNQLGGTSIVQNFDFSNANPATIALLRQEAERIKQETFNTVFGQIDRGGAYARMSGRR